jgi:hypothetical protein
MKKSSQKSDISGSGIVAVIRVAENRGVEASWSSETPGQRRALAPAIAMASCPSVVLVINAAIMKPIAAS